MILLHVDYGGHPAVRRMGLAGAALWMECLAWLEESGASAIPPDVVGGLIGSRAADELVIAGALAMEGESYRPNYGPPDFEPFPLWRFGERDDLDEEWIVAVNPTALRDHLSERVSAEDEESWQEARRLARSLVNLLDAELHRTNAIIRVVDGDLGDLSDDWGPRHEVQDLVERGQGECLRLELVVGTALVATHTTVAPKGSYDQREYLTASGLPNSGQGDHVESFLVALAPLGDSQA